jgi:trehalose 6-phosphate phosphatase
VDQPMDKGYDALQACITAMVRTPHEAALFCDIDGTVSPIAGRPQDAIVPDRTLDVLGRLIEYLGLVAFVTGRAVEDGRRLVDLDGAAYVGAHGIELIDADGVVRTEPQAERYLDQVQEMAAAAAAAFGDDAHGIVVENKRTVLAVHYRLAEDAAAARHAIITKVVDPARALGLSVSTGHFLYEVRPPVPFTKGTATRRLLQEKTYLAAMFCGDDLTDVTGFRAVREWAAKDARRTACSVAALTHETPPPVVDEADVLVAGTTGVHRVLAKLLAALGG